MTTSHCASCQLYLARELPFMTFALRYSCTSLWKFLQRWWRLSPLPLLILQGQWNRTKKFWRRARSSSRDAVIQKPHIIASLAPLLACRQNFLVLFYCPCDINKGGGNKHHLSLQEFAQCRVPHIHSLSLLCLPQFIQITPDSELYFDIMGTEQSRVQGRSID